MMEMIKLQQRVNVQVDAESGQSIETFKQEESRLMVQVLHFDKLLVGQEMTPIDKVFMLEKTQKLDFDCLANIFRSGHSRIPVYEGTSANIIGILFTKDLI